MKEFNPAFTSLSSFRKILANPFEAYLKTKKAYSFFIRLESLNFLVLREIEALFVLKKI